MVHSLRPGAQTGGHTNNPSVWAQEARDTRVWHPDPSVTNSINKLTWSLTSKQRASNQLQSDDSSDSDAKAKKRRHTKKKQKDKKKKKKRIKKKQKKEPKERAREERAEPEALPGPSLEQWQKEALGDSGPVLTDEQKSRIKAMKPMTKEEWDARQSVIRRVVDPETGRTRLIKGDGEVLEEIVSKERHKEINKGGRSRALEATCGTGSGPSTGIRELSGKRRLSAPAPARP
ncbi:PREDICTED: ADP-ribosylation factor-like protein 6-interacting protein 4 [Tinamus guttatus]|nr:PREDICTED: ADP-ribosylation factor-like protein 6-interacting protein 4 [Tinamus guttatus]